MVSHAYTYDFLTMHYLFLLFVSMKTCVFLKRKSFHETLRHDSNAPKVSCRPLSSKGSSRQRN